jgi:crotonobetainyl-CoA:carnitine CoA-transferase CaiB-like acyl-CoA transferase
MMTTVPSDCSAKSKPTWCTIPLRSRARDDYQSATGYHRPVPPSLDEPEQALQGLVIADFSRVLAGPYATMLLGDLGATVIKVESPAGDDTRRWGSTYYRSINRNKRSIVLDLSTVEGRAAAHRLIRRADVLIENFRVGGAEKLGLGYEQASALNPGLVYCSISGYGSGSGSALPAYDLVVQAVSGLVSLTGLDERHTTKAGVPIADLMAGLHAAIGILAALHHRSVSGSGQHVEVNLLSSMLSGMVNFTGAYAQTGQVARAMGIAHPSICPYEPFPTADRPLVIAAGNDRQFAALCAVLGQPDLAIDPRFRGNAQRLSHRAELASLIAALLAGRGADHWAKTLSAAGVPCGPINDVAGGVELARQLGLDPVVEVDGVAQVASPWLMHGTPVSYRHAPPDLGADTEDVLRWLCEEEES